MTTVVEDGWAALEQARWREAREAFTRALAAEDTAAAHEGLSWAAWWLDDGDTVFAARERAFMLYRTAGDPGGAELDREALEFVERWNTGDVDAELPVEYLLIVAETRKQRMSTG